MPEVSADDILNHWLGGFDKSRVPVRSEDRVVAYIDLIKTFEKYGYVKDDITRKIQTQIINISYPNTYKKKAEREKWHELCSRDLGVAIAQVYKTIEVVRGSTLEVVVKPSERESSGPLEDESIREYKEMDTSEFDHLESNPIDDSNLLKELGIDEAGLEALGIKKA